MAKRQLKPTPELSKRIRIDHDHRQACYKKLVEQKAAVVQHFAKDIYPTEEAISRLETLRDDCLGNKPEVYHTKVVSQIVYFKKRLLEQQATRDIKLYAYNTKLIDLDFGGYSQDRTADIWTSACWAAFESRHSGDSAAEMEE